MLFDDEGELEILGPGQPAAGHEKSTCHQCDNARPSSHSGLPD
jgi:hypothetical protein